MLKKPVAKPTWPSYVKRTVLSILGSVSGYVLGRELASRWHTDCASELAPEILADMAFWRIVEKERLRIYLRELLYRDDAINSARLSLPRTSWTTDPLFKCDHPMKHAVRDLRNQSRTEAFNPDSESFRAVEHIGNMAMASRKTAAYQTLQRLYMSQSIFELYQARGQTLPDNVLLRLRTEGGYTPEAWEQACSTIRLQVNEWARSAHFAPVSMWQ